MAGPRRRLIDSEWAETLVGLRMKVPANWWNSIRTRELHDGKIKSFNVLEQKWMLELVQSYVGQFLTFGLSFIGARDLKSDKKN